MKPRVVAFLMLVGALLFVGLMPVAAQPAIRQQPGPALPITAGPERIPATVLPDDAAGSYAPSISADGRYTAFGSSADNLVPGDVDAQDDVFVYDHNSGQVEVISTPPSGGPIFGTFYDPSISGDGRYVAFAGWTHDLVPGDENWSSDIYVVDRDNSSVVRISDAYDGSNANGSSYFPIISPDGGFVAFTSSASNLVADDTNNLEDVFLHDMTAGTTVRVSVSSADEEATEESYLGGVSLNGQFVSFHSHAANLVADDTNETSDVYVRDVMNGTTERVSVRDGETDNQAGLYSFWSDISADGRYVAFESYAPDLVGDDTNDVADIFIRDRLNHTTHRVSLDENGVQATEYSYKPSISADGLTVAFETYATLVAGDAGYSEDIYVRNWMTGAVTRVSVATGGGDPDNASISAALSADASTVAFESLAGNLVVGDDNRVADVFRRGLSGGQTTLVSADTFALTEPSNHVWEQAVSADGRYVAFSTDASNLVPDDNGVYNDIFIYDRQLDETTLVTSRWWGGLAEGQSNQPSISDDGSRIAYQSLAMDLIESDTNGATDIFVYDRTAGSTTRISVDSAGNESSGGGSSSPAISGDGTVVAFVADANNLVTGDNNGTLDIFVHDLTTGETERVSVSSAGDEGNNISDAPAISEDGRYIAFESFADNLAENDHDDHKDVFVHDRDTGQTTLVSVTVSGEASTYASSDRAAISADGRYISFASESDELVEDDDNLTTDVFVRDMWLGVTEKVTQAFDGGPASGQSWNPDISADGRFVVFESWAYNLVPDDENRAQDTFVYDRLTGETARLSQSAAGDEGNSDSFDAVISADGTTIVFASGASNLVPDDTYGFLDIFAVEQDTSVPTLHSVSGTVYHWEGYPLEGATLASLSVPGTTVVSDADGEYTLWLPAGTHDIVATLDNYQFLPLRQTVTLGPDRTGIDFTGYYTGLMTSWYQATDDAYVDQAKKTTNYGGATILRVKNASTDMNVYLKFAVDTLDPLPGTCRTYMGSFLRYWVKEPSVDGGSVYAVSNSWAENTINWNNAPLIGGAALGQINARTDESDVITQIGNLVNGNGVYSVAIHNGTNDSADFRSWESGWGPEIGITFRQEIIQAPTAAIAVSHGWGLAPFTVQFSDYSEGCSAAWHWDFGDGTTSNEQNPLHTFTAIGNYTVTLTVSNSEGTDSMTELIRAQEPPIIFYISTATNANLGGIAAQPADILRYDRAANNWTMVYDGSDHLTTKNIGSFAFEGTNLLLVFSVNQAIPGLGTATSRDIVRFTPNNPGAFPLGPGTFSWYRRGNAPGVGLTTTGEAIDALDQQAWSDYLSTTGAATLPTSPVIKAADEDVLEWLNWADGWAGALGIDGSSLPGLAVEDINGIWYDDNGDYYVTLLGPYNLGGVTGTGKNIVRLHKNLDGTWTPSNVPWLAAGATFPSTIDAIELAR